MRTVTSVTIAKLALAAGEQAEPVVARRVEVRAADVEDLAFDGDDLQPSRLLAVTPYFRQCAPPEFMLTLPPIMQASWLDGSGA